VRQRLPGIIARSPMGGGRRVLLSGPRQGSGCRLAAYQGAPPLQRSGQAAARLFAEQAGHIRGCDFVRRPTIAGSRWQTPAAVGLGRQAAAVQIRCGISFRVSSRKGVRFAGGLIEVPPGARPEEAGRPAAFIRSKQDPRPRCVDVDESGRASAHACRGPLLDLTPVTRSNAQS